MDDIWRKINGPMHTGLVNREIDDKTKDHIAYMGKLSNKSVENVLVVIAVCD